MTACRPEPAGRGADTCGGSGAPRRSRGLTLVELMIVVAVMAILATVAYPLYTDQVRKVRRSDGRTAVESVALAQERFYTVNGRYNVNLGSVIIDTTSSLRTGTMTLTGSSTGMTVTLRRRARCPVEAEASTSITHAARTSVSHAVRTLSRAPGCRARARRAHCA